MKRTKGRPRKENPRNMSVTVHLTEAEYDALFEVSCKLDRTMADIAREAFEMYCKVKLA